MMNSRENVQNISIRTEGWSKSERFLLHSLGAVAFALLTVLSAIRIPLPFTPVPMTLQTFIVPLSGGFLGAIWGGIAMIIYLGLGLLGLNVFASAGTGFSMFLAPTAGYLIGFPL